MYFSLLTAFSVDPALGSENQSVLMQSSPTRLEVNSTQRLSIMSLPRGQDAVPLLWWRASPHWKGWAWPSLHLGRSHRHQQRGWSYQQKEQMGSRGSHPLFSFSHPIHLPFSSGNTRKKIHKKHEHLAQREKWMITGRVLLLAADSLVLVMFPGLISPAYRSHPSAGTQAHTTARAWDRLLVYNSDWPQISSIFLKASPFCLNFFSVCMGSVYSEDWSKVFHLLGK